MDMLAVLGPTASGKSALAMRLARERGGEIVAADALMVYRGFDVGTNKPTAAEQAEIPHHLIDVCAWDEPMQAGAYAVLAEKAVREIQVRGRVPILVVGTYLYYRALRFGLLEVPAADPVLRADFAAREAADPGWLARELERVDHASFVEAGWGKNLQHLVRALEIFRLTGAPASVLRKAHGFAKARFSAEVFGLAPDRGQLARRIDARVQEMMDHGWIEEVRSLLASGVPIDARPMQAVGYRDLARALTAGTDPRACLPEIQAQTRQYARRQRSFFKQEKEVTWKEGFGT